MSRRALAEINQALMVRRLQQDAALHRLQAQQQRVRNARENRDQASDDHLDSESAWAAALGDFNDVGMIRLRRAHTAGLLEEVRAADAALTEETTCQSELHVIWGRQTRLAEAVQGVVRTATRKVQRMDDERRLSAAEDARLARRTGE